MIDSSAPPREAARLILAGHQLIVRCAGAADVIACVAFARERDLPLAMRGGGGIAVTSFVLRLHPLEWERLRNAGACILGPIEERSTP